TPQGRSIASPANIKSRDGPHNAHAASERCCSRGETNAISRARTHYPALRRFLRRRKQPPRPASSCPALSRPTRSLTAPRPPRRLHQLDRKSQQRPDLQQETHASDSKRHSSFPPKIPLRSDSRKKVECRRRSRFSK